MIDPQKLIEQFLGAGANATGNGQSGQVQSGKAGGSALNAIPESLKGFGGGMAAGGLAAVLLGTKGGRKMAKSAVKLGGLAMLGGLAYKAYNDWQATKGGNSTVSQGEAADAAPNMKNITPKAEGTPFLPAPAKERDDLALKLLQAMIAAAKADGHIDAEEQQRIFAKLDDAGLQADEKGFLMDELRKPLDIEAIVKLAETEEQAVEIYAASCLAIDPDHPAEKAYLEMLQARLGLQPALVQHVHKELERVAS